MTQNAASSDRRNVGVGLGVGIVLLPIVFAWFTLRSGYSTLAKVLSFVWLAIGVIVVSVSGKGDGGAASAGRGTPSPEATSVAPVPAASKDLSQATPRPAPAEPAKPEFVRTRHAACVQYKAAPNEIKKSAVFSDYTEVATKAPATVSNIAGTLDKIETPQGGGSVLIVIESDLGKFGNNDVLQGGIMASKREIKKGTPLYKAIGELAEGKQVKFSGSLVIPEKNPLSEELGVCGDDWLIKFDKIELVQ